MKELTIAQLSRLIEFKRQRLRDLLAVRQVTDYNFVNVRMSNVYDLTRMLEMAIKKQNNKEVKKAEFRGFFNVEIPTEMKADCKAFIRNDEEIALLIEEALSSGYKITVTKDVKNDSLQATMQCNNASDPNAGLCMSAYSPHWYNSIAVLMWKHFKMLNKSWEAYDKETPRDDFG